MCGVTQSKEKDLVPTSVIKHEEKNEERQLEFFQLINTSVTPSLLLLFPNPREAILLFQEDGAPQYAEWEEEDAQNGLLDHKT